MTKYANSEEGVRIQHLEQENEFLLTHLHHAQEELERQVLFNRRQEQKITSRLDPITVSPVFVAPDLSLFAKLTDLLGWTSKRKVAAIQQSGCFDCDWYLSQYPDVADSGLDPIRHYLRFGAKEKRNPSEAFDTAWYLGRYPDVAKNGMNPLLHYIKLGQSEGRQPASHQQPGANIGLVAQAMQKLTSRIEEQFQEIETLVVMRDQQATLVAERQSQLEALAQAHALLEADKAALTEQRDAQEQALAALSQERDQARAEAADRQLGIERLQSEQTELEQQLFAGQSQIEALIQTRNQQASLAAERQSRIETLTQERAVLVAEKQALSEQRSSLEGELAAITQEQNERQQQLEKESLLADRQLAEIKQWLLSEAHV